jgi:DNA-nicking Smr family endonuclease
MARGRRDDSFVTPSAPERRRSAPARRQEEKAERLPAKEQTGDGNDGSEDEIDFSRAIGELTPLRKTNRAEISLPRPAPLPRPRERNGDDAVPPAAFPSPPSDPLAAAYAGVTPIATGDRREPDPPRRRARPPATALAPDRPETSLPAAPETGDHHATLFRAVVGAVLPLTTSRRLNVAPPPPPPVPRQHQIDEQAALAESLCRKPSVEDYLDSGEEDAFLRPGIQRRVLTDLRRGRWTPQDKIDLHGLTRDEARTALSLFLTATLAQGKRCIRVIHGKGLGSPGGIPILKKLSRSWLAQREEILAFCQANPHDGGAGALLVLLRAPSIPGDRGQKATGASRR